MFKELIYKWPKDHLLVKKRIDLMLIVFFFFFWLQVEDLAERLLKWVKVGGCIFFRESCFHQSGDHKRKQNPTHYREPRFYTKVQIYWPWNYEIVLLDFTQSREIVWVCESVAKKVFHKTDNEFCDLKLFLVLVLVNRKFNL